MEEWPSHGSHLCAMLLTPLSLLFAFVREEQFSPMLGCRIGEAANPGPTAACQLDSKSITITIANPSALYGKIDEVRAIDSDVVCFSETSLTSSACSFITREFSKEGFTPFFSKHAPAKFVTVNGRTSLRGEAVGTAIISKLPSRRHRFDMLPVFYDSCRINSRVIRIDSREFLFVSIYGFTNSHFANKKSTMSLVLYALQMACESGLPCVIAGDMNCDITKLDGWSVLVDAGFVEAHDFVSKKLLKTLPHTCRGATSFDTILIPPQLQPLLIDAWVSQDKLFDSHDPLTLKFSTHGQSFDFEEWRRPKSWTFFDIPRPILVDAFDQAADKAVMQDKFRFQDSSWTFDEAVLAWSELAENAVSNAISRHHAIDNVRQPSNSLPFTFRGRGRGDSLDKTVSSSSPKPMKQNGYEPPVEAFNMKVKHKVRQTRRLRSLCHVLQKHEAVALSPSRIQDLQVEWNRILKAPGYGSSWSKWILRFPPITVVSSTLPERGDVEIMAQITQFDCDAYSRQLQLNKKNVMKFKIETDTEQNFGKMTYAWLRRPQNDPISSVSTKWTTQAKMIRLPGNKIALRLEHSSFFVMHSPAMFGDAVIVPLTLEDCVMTFRVQSGIIPCTGTLSQDAFACTGPELAKTFEDYWSPMWNRDAYDEQFSDDSWHAVVDAVRNTQHGVPPLPQIDMSADAWYATVCRLKPGKAVGRDGFHHEDLLSLPKRAYEIWSQIIQHFSDEGFSMQLMRAKVVLLSKVSDPQHIKDGRPITVLGSLVRLVTSHFARQIMHHWSYFMPCGLSGGLPGRGVNDIVWSQQFELEKAKLESSPMSGYTLDLSKAFNRLPRRVMRQLIVTFGIPQWCVDFWVKSLSNMTRTLCHNRQYFGLVSSTSGAPEGDAMAVVGMVAISYAWMLTMQTQQVKLYAYADNWSWMTPDARLHIQLCYDLVAFADACRLVVDFSKSWFWTTHSSHQKYIHSHAHSLPDQIVVTFQKHAKDLGSCINYSKLRTLGCVKDRITATLSDFVKLQYMQISPQEKAKRVQVALWPRALYGAELVAPGNYLYKKLRRAATNAITGQGKHATSDILCHFVFPKLCDPQVFTMINALRTIRRLYEVTPHVANEMINTVAQACGRRVLGPCSALATMLHRIGWTFDHDGCLQAPGFPKLRLLTSSNDEIKRYCIDAWTDVCHGNVCHRKGFDESKPLDRSLMFSVWDKIPHKDFAVVLPYILGSFQSQTVKASWDAGINDRCELCGMTDTKEHRLLHCAALEPVRRDFPNVTQDWLVLSTITFGLHYRFVIVNKFSFGCYPRRDHSLILSNLFPIMVATLYFIQMVRQTLPINLPCEGQLLALFRT